MRSASAAGTAPARYEQHRPEQTVLYRIIAEHLETYLRHVSEQHERGLPKYVENDLRAYLQCGIHAHGFLRAQCKLCRQDLVVAFSCKRRAVCPSCCARRMAGTAAHLVDHVIGSVPLRQWVLSVPFELRILLAKRPNVLSKVGRTFVEQVFRWQREKAEALGIRAAKSGAVCFVHRFGGSLNLNVHFHAAIPDGVFARTEHEARAQFHQLGSPRKSDIEEIALNTATRVVRWLGRKGLVNSEPGDDRPPVEPTALDACLQGSLGLGQLVSLKETDPEPTAHAVPDTLGKSRRRGAKSLGFDVHAGVLIGANDRQGRERLLRYCARAPLSLERLSLTPEGLVAYKLRKEYSSGRTHRIMTPLQFLARLSALVPPPRHPLIRFHGVYAPHSSWRKSVVPKRHGCNEPPLANDSAAGVGESCHMSPDPPAPPAPSPSCLSPTSTNQGGGDGSVALLPTTGSEPAGGQSALHCGTFAQRHPSARIDWAELLKRIHSVDALACTCGGRLRFIALITEPETARAILESLSLPSEPPPVLRARSPDWL